MFASKFKAGEVVTRIDFNETVKSIPVGQTRYFEIAGTLSTGITTACSRLKKTEGLEFRTKTDGKSNRLLVHRLK